MKLRNFVVLFAASALILTSCDMRNAAPKASLQFFETYGAQEIDDYLYPTLNVFDRSLCNDGEERTPLSRMLCRDYNVQGDQVGYSSSKDTAAVNEILEQAYANGVFDKNEILFAWNAACNDVIGLYALKLTEGKSALEGVIVEKAEASTDMSGNPSIYVTFKPEAALAFAELSERNINRPIAIAIDGRVRCVPYVRCRIDGGKVEITGNFTEEETEELASAMSPGWIHGWSF